MPATNTDHIVALSSLITALLAASKTDITDPWDSHQWLRMHADGDMCEAIRGTYIDTGSYEMREAAEVNAAETKAMSGAPKEDVKSVWAAVEAFCVATLIREVVASECLEELSNAIDALHCRKNHDLLLSLDLSDLQAFGEMPSCAEGDPRVISWDTAAGELLVWTEEASVEQFGWTSIIDIDAGDDEEAQHWATLTRMAEAQRNTPLCKKDLEAIAHALRELETNFEHDAVEVFRSAELSAGLRLMVINSSAAVNGVDDVLMMCHQGYAIRMDGLDVVKL